MSTQQNGKIALITGAASGIGSELTRLFAKDGYELILVDRDGDGISQLAYNLKNQYGTTATLITKDLADPKAPDEIYAETTGNGQQVDVLVNDAGFGQYGLFATDTDLQQELAIVQTNATALMHLTKLYVKDMVGRKEGKILMLGSEVSVAPNPMMAVYGATKAFVKSFSEALRNELKDTGVTVTVLMPGATNTNFFKTAGAQDAKGADPQKTANPSEVAKAGYDALMSGQDHVVAGFMNKIRVAMAHVLPDPLVAASVRSDMASKEEAEQQQKTTIAIAVGVAAAVVGLFWLARRGTLSVPISEYDKARYQYKGHKAKKFAQHALDSATDSVKDTYKQAKSTVKDAIA